MIFMNELNMPIAAGKTNKKIAECEGQVISKFMQF